MYKVWQDEHKIGTNKTKGLGDIYSTSFTVYMQNKLTIQAKTQKLLENQTQQYTYVLLLLILAVDNHHRFKGMMEIHSLKTPNLHVCGFLWGQ